MPLSRPSRLATVTVLSVALAVLPQATGAAASAPVRSATLTTGERPASPAITALRGTGAPRATFTARAPIARSAPIASTLTRRSGVPYRPDSAWNARIPAAPVLDPASAALGRHLGAAGRAYADLYEYGVPVFDAYASTPRYAVACNEPWGTCGLERGPVPIPAGAVPSSGSDGAMVVIDWSTRRTYEFWRARRTASGGWTASWGSVGSVDGTGVDATAGSPTGAGVPRLAGVVRAFEIAQGRIDHALVVSTDSACPRIFRFPATKTDGASRLTPCVPEGARLQLDPTIDVDALPGITPGERAVARALQVYGAYVIDNGGARLAVIFEDPRGEANPYPGAGLGWDYYDMPHVPWSRLRVLRTWNGR